MGQLILILLVCALLGCSSPTPALNIAALDGDLAEPLALSVQRWHAATGLEFRRRPGGVWVQRGECADPELLGCQIGNEIKIHPRVKADAERVLAHEIGHALGVSGKHVDGNGHPIAGLMAPAIGEHTSTCLTTADVDAVCAVKACPWRLPECG